MKYANVGVVHFKGRHASDAHSMTSFCERGVFYLSPLPAVPMLFSSRSSGNVGHPPSPKALLLSARKHHDPLTRPDPLKTPKPLNPWIISVVKAYLRVKAAIQLRCLAGARDSTDLRSAACYSYAMQKRLSVRHLLWKHEQMCCQTRPEPRQNELEPASPPVVMSRVFL